MNEIIKVKYIFDDNEYEIVDLFEKEGFCSIAVNHWSGKPYKMYVPLKHIIFK